MACSAKLPPVPNSNPCAVLRTWRWDLIVLSIRRATLFYILENQLNQQLGVLIPISWRMWLVLDATEVHNFHAVFWPCGVSSPGTGAATWDIFFIQLS
jgi:hypothetical protein